MDGVKHLLSKTLQHLIFYKYFLITFAVSLMFLYIRGFGWDGDTVTNLATLIPLINTNLYPDPSYLLVGASPKIFNPFVLGLLYFTPFKLYALTFFSIFLHAVALSALCSWVHKSKGVWFIPLIGLLMNNTWMQNVINCDNPAISINFAM